MTNLKSILPSWLRQVTGGEAASGALPAKPEVFGKASSFELQFDRLMDDPEARRDTLFPAGNCR